MAEESHVDLLVLTTEIVANHIGNNQVDAKDVPGLIGEVHKALAALGKTTPATIETPKPAVAIRTSVKPDHIVCLEDGKKLTMLKRYLRARYDMSPADYRAKWGLPADYPMVAPDYADRRRVLAKQIGLGRTKRKS